MKTRLIILAVLALAVVSCAKKSADFSAPNGGMKFVASNGASAIKSHFEDISTSGQLVWDDEDVLGIYAFDPTAAEPFGAGSLVQEKAYIDPADAGKKAANFMSILSEDEWFGEATQKSFFAYYPCIGPQGELQTINYTEEGVIVETKHVFPCYVEDEQFPGEGFKKHQFLYSQGTSAAKGEVVNLGTFTPYTALIRFRMKSNTSYEWNIGEIRFSYGYLSPYSDELRSDAGTALTGLHLLEVSNDGLTVSPATEVSLDNSDYYSDSSSLSMVFSLGNDDYATGTQGVLIKKDQYTDYFFFACLPTLRPRNDMKIRIEAEAYELFDETYYGKVFKREVDAPADLAGGFESGKCYSFAIDFDEGELSVGYEGSTNVGAYEINTEWGEEE